MEREREKREEMNRHFRAQAYAMESRVSVVVDLREISMKADVLYLCCFKHSDSCPSRERWRILQHALPVKAC